jgi:hypothetical protein
MSPARLRLGVEVPDEGVQLTVDPVERVEPDRQDEILKDTERVERPTEVVLEKLPRLQHGGRIVLGFLDVSSWKPPGSRPHKHGGPQNRVSSRSAAWLDHQRREAAEREERGDHHEHDEDRSAGCFAHAAIFPQRVWESQ